jgi:hypothetical protein
MVITFSKQHFGSQIAVMKEKMITFSKHFGSQIAVMQKKNGKAKLQ